MGGRRCRRPRGRRVGKARRSWILPRRHSLFARVRDADGRHLLRAEAGRRREGARPGLDSVLSRPPDVSAQGDEPGADRAGAARGRQPARSQAARVRRQAGHPPLRRAAGARDGLRGDLPLEDPGGLRRAGHAHHRHRFAHSPRRRDRGACIRRWDNGHLQLVDHEGRARAHTAVVQGCCARDASRKLHRKGPHARDPAPSLRARRARDRPDHRVRGPGCGGAFCG